MQFAGMALVDTMCSIDLVSPNVTEQMEAAGRDEVTLLYDWLESVLLGFELKGLVFSKFKVATIVKTATDLRFSAEAYGERYDREKHGMKVEVKAVTYHRMEVVKQSDCTVLRFILDL